MHPLIETAKVIVEKGAKYLTLEGIVAKLKGWTQNIAVVDALGLASENRNVRTENTVFLGCLSALEAFPVDEKAIRESSLAVPKTIEQNLKAFDLVKKSAHSSLCTLVQCRPLP
jgi:Pyruvate/2-oxoacid:ferredoxin oxidoreductase gamma subunit